MYDVTVDDHSIFIGIQTLVLIISHIKKKREVGMLVGYQFLIECLGLTRRVSTDGELKNDRFQGTVDLSGIITLVFTVVIKMLNGHAVLFQHVHGVVEEIIHHDNGLQFIRI
jgi:hypothetical protein